MKSKWALLALVLTMSVLLAACGGSNESKKKALTAQADQKLLRQQEKSFISKAVSAVTERLRRRRRLNLQEVGGKYDEAKIESIIKNGRGNMPSHLVNDKEAAEIAKWLSQKK